MSKFNLWFCELRAFNVIASALGVQLNEWSRRVQISLFVGLKARMCVSNCVNVATLTYVDMYTWWTLLLCYVFVLFPTVAGRVQVAVRLDREMKRNWRWMQILLIVLNCSQRCS